jgi:ABC-type nitrate/sulfonate/bicarbonate transport system permease component
VAALAWAGAELALRLAFGRILAPGPLAVLESLRALSLDGSLFLELGHTVGRALLGVLLANALGVPLGLLAGRLRFLLRYTAPLMAGLQSCPPVVWISLAMVLAGTGSLVPVLTVFAATLPIVFSNTAQGAMGLPERVVLVGRLYGVPFLRRFKDFTLPGILPYFLAGLSTVLSTAWKAAAVAEFMGSHDGAGSRIYWCYSRLDMEALHAWALAIIVLGMGLEGLVITPLRNRAAAMASRGA